MNVREILESAAYRAGCNLDLNQAEQVVDDQLAALGAAGLVIVSSPAGLVYELRDRAARHDNEQLVALLERAASALMGANHEQTSQESPKPASEFS